MSQSIQQKSKSQSLRILISAAAILAGVNLVLTRNDKISKHVTMVLFLVGVYFAVYAANISPKTYATKRNALILTKYLLITAVFFAAAAAFLGYIIHLGVE